MRNRQAPNRKTRGGASINKREGDKQGKDRKHNKDYANPSRNIK